MSLSIAARFGLAVLIALWVSGATVYASGGHDHEHAETAKSETKSASLRASSELFDLVGTVHEGRLRLSLTNRANSRVASDARIDVTIDGQTLSAAAQPDGSFSVELPLPAQSGPREIIASIQDGKVSDLLVGILSTASPASDGHDHGPTADLQDTFLVSMARQPIAAIGGGLALVAFGIVVGLQLSGRRSGLTKPLLTAGAVLAIASLVAGMVTSPTRNTAALPVHEHKAEVEREGVISMTSAQIEAAKIRVEPAQSGSLSQRLSVPAVIVPDARKLARVPAQVVGTVSEIQKHVGDFVVRGEVIAVISSREVADAKSEYLAATVNLELQKTLHDRSLSLWEKRVTAEQQYLQVKATYTQAQLRLDLARQKLSSLGLDAGIVSDEAKQDSTSAAVSRLRTYEVRSPIAGRVVERKVDVGTPVGKEGDASELYLIADLSAVWAELSVPLADLDHVKEDQSVTINAGEKSNDGKIIFVSPIIGSETRSARVIAAFDNKDMTWRPGTFVTAHVALDTNQVAVRIPRTAVQTIEGKQVVFARTKAGFEKREVTLGRADDRAVEVVAGLSGGELIAATNTFLLKADLGKSEAEHSH